MEHNYSIKFNNVLLRPLEHRDIEHLRNWRNNKDNSKFLRELPYITREAQEEWYKKYLKNDDEICFAIEECIELNRLVGSLSLYNFRGDTAEFGKILIGNKEAHGRQVGYNATGSALKIAFNELKFKKIVLEVYENNIAAKTIYEKAGFVFKCILKEDDIGKVLIYEIICDKEV